MLLSQVLNYRAGSFILSSVQSTFLDGNEKILKQPFKMLWQHVGVRRAIARIANVDVHGKNVWTSANVSENVKTFQTFYTVLDLSYVNLLFPDLRVPCHTYLQYYFLTLDVFVVTSNDRNKEFAVRMSDCNDFWDI